MSGKEVTYLAAREMISGRSVDDEVTLDLDGVLKSQDRRPKMMRKINGSISNVVQITFEHLTYTWAMRTIPLVNDDTGANLFREFLASCVDQTFEYRPGTEYDGGASPATSYTVVLDSFSEARTRIGVGVDRFSFTFSLRQVANA